MPSEWNFKTRYKAILTDAIDQRVTAISFLLDRYGISAVEDFFLYQNLEWMEQLKIGKLKKMFVKLVAKLLPKQIMEKVCDIVIENSQTFIGLDQSTIVERTDTSMTVEVSKCTPLKRCKKVIRKLNFESMDDRFVCKFTCLPILNKMVGIANCEVTVEYVEKGCYLTILMISKEGE